MCDELLSLVGLVWTSVGSSAELIHGRYDVEYPSVSMDWKYYVVMSKFIMRVVRVSVMCVCLVREGGGEKGG